jgi:hypothetical protein
LICAGIVFSLAASWTVFRVELITRSDGSASPHASRNPVATSIPRY